MEPQTTLSHKIILATAAIFTWVTKLDIHFHTWELALWDPMNKLVYVDGGPRHDNNDPLQAFLNSPRDGRTGNSKDKYIARCWVLIREERYRQANIPSLAIFKDPKLPGSNYPLSKEMKFCRCCDTGKLVWQIELGKKIELYLRRLKISMVQWYKYKYLRNVK